MNQKDLQTAEKNTVIQAYLCERLSLFFPVFLLFGMTVLEATIYCFVLHSMQHDANTRDAWMRLRSSDESDDGAVKIRVKL